MKKIPSVFQRNYTGDRLVRDEVVEGCEWVLAGEGTATEKFDGTAVMFRGDVMYKRYDRKRGKPAPEGWEPCEPEPNPHTGHWPGWVPVRAIPSDVHHLMGWVVMLQRYGDDIPDATYELVGPKVNGNPHELAHIDVWMHGGIDFDEPEKPRTFESIRAMVEHLPTAEGIVFWHPDGRMAKVKRRDFGFGWGGR